MSVKKIIKEPDVQFSVEELRLLLADMHESNINVSTREVYLHSYFELNGEDSGMDYKMSSVFLKNMNLLNMISTDNILIHQQSVGGDWFCGIAIYDIILASASHTTMLSNGIAASMASLTLQACDTRVLFPNCEFMIHFGSLGASGINKEVYASVEQCKTTDTKMLEIFSSRCMNGSYFKNKKFTKKQVISYLKRRMGEKVDWYMSAEEALEYGFIDGILGQKGFEDANEIRKTRRNIKKYRKN